MAVRTVAWAVGAAAMLLAVLSGWADHRRGKRDDLDRIGIIDWRTLQLAAIGVTLVAVSVALNA